MLFAGVGGDAFCLLLSKSAELYLSRKLASLDYHVTMDEVRDEATVYWMQAGSALTTSIVDLDDTHSSTAGRRRL